MRQSLTLAEMRFLLGGGQTCAREEMNLIGDHIQKLFCDFLFGSIFDVEAKDISGNPCIFRRTARKAKILNGLLL